MCEIYELKINVIDIMGYKRVMPQATKDKISAALKGRKMSNETKKKIGDKVREAWAKVPKLNNSECE